MYNQEVSLIICPISLILTSEKVITGDGEDEFGSDDFDEVDFSVPCADHPDEITLDTATSSAHCRRRNSLPIKNLPTGNISNRSRSSPKRLHHTVSEHFPKTPQTGRGSADPGIAQRDAAPNQHPQMPPIPQHQQTGLPPPKDSLQQAGSRRSPSGSLLEDESKTHSSYSSTHEPPVGFFTARAAESLQSGSVTAVKAPAFDPHLESPSIRKTAGIDHTKTKPVNRENVVPPAVPAPPRGNFVHPTTDKARRVGMPAFSGPSPVQNRGSYKPPQMKRPADEHLPRTALTDVTNNIPAGIGDDKRQRKGLEGQNSAMETEC